VRASATAAIASTTGIRRVGLFARTVFPDDTFREG
jgi:hypothetical protein